MFIKAYFTSGSNIRCTVNMYGRVRISESVELAEALFDLTTLSTVHDIGKIAISEQLLNKSEKLSAKEWEELKTHPVMSNRILRATRMVSFAVEEGVFAHHEHWDGGGYPNGLKATAIPLLSRIIAIIDAYDVMTHDRPYQTAITHEGAKAELQRCAGSQFDPELGRHSATAITSILFCRC